LSEAVVAYTGRGAANDEEDESGGGAVVDTVAGAAGVGSASAAAAAAAPLADASAKSALSADVGAGGGTMSVVDGGGGGGGSGCVGGISKQMVSSSSTPLGAERAAAAAASAAAAAAPPEASPGVTVVACPSAPADEGAAVVRGTANGSESTCGRCGRALSVVRSMRAPVLGIWMHSWLFSVRPPTTERILYATAVQNRSARNLASYTPCSPASSLGLAA